MDRIKQWMARAKQSSLWRAWQRYSERRGNLLAGGVAFNAFFSLFALMGIAVTVFGFLLQDRPDWIQAINDGINEQLPGFIKTDSNGDGAITDADSGILPPIQPISSAALASIASVSFALALWTGLSWLSALRNGIREIFGAEGSPGNFALAKLRDLGVLILLGLGIALSAALSAVASALAQMIADLIGLGGQGWILSAVGLLIGLLLDAGLVALMLRILSGVDLPWKGVRNGALFGGLGLTLLKFFGTQLLAGTMTNPVFAGFALVVGLLVWLNFMSRIVLIAAAWAANDLEARGEAPAMNAGGFTAGAHTSASVGAGERAAVAAATTGGLGAAAGRHSGRRSSAAYAQGRRRTGKGSALSGIVVGVAGALGGKALWDRLRG